MAEEREELGSNRELFPKGEDYIFTYLGRSDKIRAGKSHYRFWKFSSIVNDTVKNLSVLYFPWEIEELGLALGGRIEMNEGVKPILVFDSEKAVEEKKEIMADVFHIEIQGKMRAKLKNIRPHNDFGPEDTKDVPF